MVINAETRAALLDGSQFGFVAVGTAPKWAADRIVEVRAAMFEKRAVPAPSREYLRAAEERGLATHASSRRLPTLRKGQSYQDLYFEQTGREFQPAPIVSVRKVNSVARVDKRKVVFTPAALADMSRRTGISVARLQSEQQRSLAKILGAEIEKERRDAARNEQVAVAQMTQDELRQHLDRTLGWN